MSATKLKTVKPSKSLNDIQFQEASLDIWDKKYPPSAMEIDRARKIEKIQGNRNHFIFR